MKRVVLLNIYRGRQNIISENKDNIQQKQINKLKLLIYYYRKVKIDFFKLGYLFI